MDKQELLDIVAPLAPPPAPPPYGWIALGIGLVVLLLGGLLYFFWRRNRDRRAALAQLKRTAHALRYQRIDARSAAFQTGSALRGIPGSLSRHASTDWESFFRALDQARFAPYMPSVDTSAQLIERARDLLRAQC